MGGISTTYVADVDEGQRHVVTLGWSFKAGQIKVTAYEQLISLNAGNTNNFSGQSDMMRVCTPVTSFPFCGYHPSLAVMISNEGAK